jgi:Family of unknown function (DUF6338)
MLPTTIDALNILIFLLPGFRSDRIVVSLNAPRKRSDIVLVTDALVLSFIDYVVYSVVSSRFKLPAIPIQISAGATHLSSDQAASLGALLFVALAVGLFWAKASNAGWVYGCLRWAHLTRVTGRVDVWHDVFTEFHGRWLQVILKDGTGITGWPGYFSDDPDKRELFIREAFVEPPEGNDYDVPGPGILLTELTEIMRVQILPE